MALGPTSSTIQPDSVVSRRGDLDSSQPRRPGRTRIEADSGLKAGQWQVAVTALAAKFLIFIFATESYLIVGNEPIHGFKGWLGIFNRWDTVHYIDIAQQ